LGCIRAQKLRVGSCLYNSLLGLFIGLSVSILCMCLYVCTAWETYACVCGQERVGHGLFMSMCVYMCVSMCISVCVCVCVCVCVFTPLFTERLCEPLLDQ